MRRWGWLVLLVQGQPIAAGLYNPVEPAVEPNFAQFFNSENPRQAFFDTLQRFRSIAMPKIEIDNPTRERYILVADGIAKNVDRLTSDQKIALSEYWIRRQKYLEAIELLKPLDDRTDLHFLALSNQATAWHLFADGAGTDKLRGYEQAQYFLEQALQAWPDDWTKLSDKQRELLRAMHWTEDPFGRFRQAEEYYLKLLKLRQREILLRKTPAAIDALFADDQGPLVFVGDSGQFLPGQLSAKELTKLPNKRIDSALQIVQQLLVWLPHDSRLYWQLGELYNAKGDTAAARYIFNDLVTQMQVSFYDELKKHRSILNEYKEEPKKLTVKDQLLQDRIVKMADDDEPQFNWRILGVGFVVGFLVGIFALFQFRETRRRMRERNF